MKDFIMVERTNSDTKSSISAQSLDVYHCYSADDQEQVDTILLIGTRNGSILETKISNKYQGLKIATGSHTKDVGSEKITLNEKCHHNSFPSGGSYNFDINNKYMVTYCTTSLYVVFWNIDEREFVKSIKLSNYPSVVKFSQTNFLAVGTFFGSTEFYELNEPLSIAPKEDKLFYTSEYYPSAIKFSSNDKKVAICYKRMKASQKEEESNLFVLCVYEKFLKEGKSEKFWIKVSNDEHKFIEEFHFNASGDRMLIFYSDFDRWAHPFKKTSFTLVIYDLVKRTEKKELAEEDFNEINFSIAIEAYYEEYPELIVFDADSESESKQLSNAKVTAMTQYDKNTIMGTHNGEIFVVRSDEFFTDLDLAMDKEQKVYVNFIACSPNPIQNMHILGDLLFVSC